MTVINILCLTGYTLSGTWFAVYYHSFATENKQSTEAALGNCKETELNLFLFQWFGKLNIQANNF